ncbi:hypothetical protein CH380_11105 [Leptospira adleri]|uniref:Uncharacterized protein n=1 Tax=Leptospira adleri TaxID=2023186 RepID=A0A2M9YP98_9LEPT|nr:hypothetical protein CH380_11105 [Leptospira adleri]PJZ59887.1 hypothetical protein CH376_21265 [Leptospira adleri]
MPEFRSDPQSQEKRAKVPERSRFRATPLLSFQLICVSSYFLRNLRKRRNLLFQILAIRSQNFPKKGSRLRFLLQFLRNFRVNRDHRIFFERKLLLRKTRKKSMSSYFSEKRRTFLRSKAGSSHIRLDFQKVQTFPRRMQKVGTLTFLRIVNSFPKFEFSDQKSEPCEVWKGDSEISHFRSLN